MVWEKYGLITLGRPSVRCYSTLRAWSPACGSTLCVSHVCNCLFLSRICRPQEEPLFAGRVRVHTCCECYNKRGYIRTWYVYKVFFFIFRLMRYTNVCFFSLSGVLFPRESTNPQLNKTVKHDNIRESDRHDSRLYVHSLVCLAHLQNDRSC